MRYKSVFAVIATVMVMIVAAPAFGQSLIGTYNVVANPRKVAVNPVTGKIYILTGSSSGMSIVNGATHAVTSVATGSNPSDIAVNPVSNKIYVANKASTSTGTITVIDGTTDAVIKTISGFAESPEYIAVDPVINRVFALTRSVSGELTVIDGSADTVITSLGSIGSSPVGLAVNPVTHYVYVSGLASSSVVVVNGQTAALVRSIAIGQFTHGIVVNPVTNKVYVSDGTAEVFVINGELSGTPATLMAGSVTTGAEPYALVVNPVTNKVYTANYTGHSVTLINGASGATLATAGPTTILNASATPVSLVYDAYGNRVWVNDITNGYLYQVSGSTGAVLYSVAMLQSVDALAVNPVTGRVYMALPSTGRLGVMDTRNNIITTHSTVAGGSPIAVAANPNNGKSYAANTGSNSLTVLNPGFANVDVPLGGVPVALAVNPQTSRVYVLLDGGASAGSLKIISGASDAVITTLPVGIGPKALAINEVSNRIYVANETSNTVTVIDGAANSVLASPALAGSGLLEGAAANPATNRIYILRFNGLVTLNGNDNSQSALSTGIGSFGMALNRITNKIYIASSFSSGIIVVDGATQAVSSIPTATSGTLIAVNEQSNKIYLAYAGSPGKVYIADGAGSGTLLASLTLGASLGKNFAVNPNSNNVYIPDGGGNLFVIDGISNAMRLTLATGYTTPAIALNPVSGLLTLGAGAGANNLTNVLEKALTNIPLDVTVTPLAANTTTDVSPVIVMDATSSYSPTAPVPRDIFYQVDGWQGAWQTAYYNFLASNWDAYPGPLGYGEHTIYAWSGDGQEATSINPASSPIPGQVAAYTFLVAPDAPAISAQPVNQSVCNLARAVFTVTASVKAGGTVSYQWRRSGLNLTDSGNVSGSLTATLTLDPVITANAGTFDVVITNTLPSYVVTTLSSPATLTVDAAHTPPTEALTLKITKGAPDTLTWSPPANGGGYPVTYDVLRSVNLGNFTNTIGTTCIATGISGVSLGDSLNGDFWYLVRAINACGSTLGANSSGVPIPGRSCP